MGKYQAYPEYKESGVEWLEDTPTHWGAKPLKFLCTYNDEVLADSISDDYEFEYVDIGSVSATEGVTKTESMIFGKAPSRARRIVRDGDVIVSTVRTYLEAITPIDNPPKNIVVSTGFAVIRPNWLLYKGYAAYCLRASGFIKEVVARSVGISYPAINASDLVNIKVPEPMLDEQEKIANFLDYETAKIDTLIEKQRQLIKLLKEKSQAVVSHAVTKGLNPNAPMRDSGIEWLGEVPEHWALPKISHIARVLNGSTPDKNNLDYWESGSIPWLASGCLNSEIVDEPSLLITEAAYQSCTVELIPANSLLVGMVGQGKTRGTSAILAIDSCINQNIAAIIPDMKIQIRFLYFLFQAMYDDLRELGRGGNQAALNCEIIGSIRIPLPPVDEQIAIVNMLDTLSIKLSDTVSLGGEQIELLQERRTALISAAVTGKIDVRNWVAPSHPCDRDIGASLHVTTPEPSDHRNKEVAA